MQLLSTALPVRFANRTLRRPDPVLYRDTSGRLQCGLQYCLKLNNARMRLFIALELSRWDLNQWPI